jgi:hypothetical protein
MTILAGSCAQYVTLSEAKNLDYLFGVSPRADQLSALQFRMAAL